MNRPELSKPQPANDPQPALSLREQYSHIESIAVKAALDALISTLRKTVVRDTPAALGDGPNSGLRSSELLQALTYLGVTAQRLGLGCFTESHRRHRTAESLVKHRIANDYSRTSDRHHP